MATQDICNGLGIRNPWPAQKPDVPPDPHHWFLESNKDMLNRRLMRDGMKVLELGAWLGGSTRWFASKASEMVTIDTWLGTAGEHDQMTREIFDRLLTLWDTFVVNCWDYRENLLPLRTWTSVGMELLIRKGWHPDLIYIDADHTFEGAKRDILHAMRFPPHAIICGDDFRWGGDLPVQRAVMEVAHMNGYKVGDHGNLWWFER